MLKTLLIAGTALIAAPSLAQQSPGAPMPQTPPVATPNQGQAMPSDMTSPSPSQTPGQTMPAAPTQTQQVPDTSTTQTTETPTTNAGDQVAQTVDSQWASYDANSDGKLSKKEFAAWMGSLRANDPSAKGGATEMKKWNDTAFAQSDTDKNGAVSKDELKGFLAQPAK